MEVKANRVCKNNKNGRGVTGTRLGLWFHIFAKCEKVDSKDCSDNTTTARPCSQRYTKNWVL